MQPMTNYISPHSSSDASRVSHLDGGPSGTAAPSDYVAPSFASITTDDILRALISWKDHSRTTYEPPFRQTYFDVETRPTTEAAR